MVLSVITQNFITKAPNGTIVYVDPSHLTVPPCNDFSVNVNIENVVDLWAWQFNMTFDPNLMTCISINEGSFLQLSGPTIWLSPIINNDEGWIFAGCSRIGQPPGSSGSGTLAHIIFHCEGSGTSILHFKHPDPKTMLLNSYQLEIPFTTEDGTVTQETMYWKANYIDYAPSGVPDFDQRQDNWGKIDPGSGVWKWTYCGPTAVANSLWWMDSRFEPGITPPPTISDKFPLLTAYGLWDDHDPRNVQPFITDLGWYMDTDGARTGYPWNGTDVHQMVKGVAMYLRDRGLETDFAIKKVKMPNFFYVEEEIEKCEDVILLLGIWQSNDGINWWRVGGHYVTCAGVDSANTLIAFSDPDANTAEAGGMGRVLPPGVPHPHPPRPIMPPEQDTVHNNASFVSHDVYSINSASPSPGGAFAINFYEPITNPEFMQNIQGQNCPSEFKSKEGDWNPQAAFTAVEVEYSISISPADWYFKPEQIDYAPSGVPDFDQKQWLAGPNWTNPYPPIGTWSYCGPVAVANSLWWLDSEFEPNRTPPPQRKDGFALVESYSPDWDDHDPQNVPYLVEHLAWYMDTNGMRTGSVHCGTEVHSMEYGIDWYLRDKGVDWKFYEHTEQRPDFFWIENEIKRCEDVILLLGFWQESPTQPGYWWRVGGHYVTCAGVDSANMMLAISDPFIDNAEWGFPGRVIPPTAHPHTDPPETLHNNATYVSHDFYLVGSSPSPGGYWGLYQYPAEDIIDNFGSCQNTPEEFWQYDGPYMPGLPIYTEIEYAVVISCKTGLVAAGNQDTNVYCWDFNGNLQWTWATGAPVLSVAFDNDGRYLVSGSRHLPDGPGVLSFFDAHAVTNGGINMPLWAMQLNISESYDGGWMGTESKSVDIKYNKYNGFDVVAAATDQGLYLFDQWGAQIFHYWDEDPQGTVWPETIVRISQDGNYIVCASHTGPGRARGVHYFSHLRDGIPGWGPEDGTPVWDFWMTDTQGVFWVAISGLGDYVAVSGWFTRVMSAYVTLLSGNGSQIWLYSLALPSHKGGYVRVDMPCDGRSVVAVNDDPSNTLGTDLLYFSDGGDGWDSSDGAPVWMFWPDKELGGGQNTMHDFYTVAISGNGNYTVAGGVPSNAYLLDKNGNLQQKVGPMPQAVQSVDLTFTGKYGAAVDLNGTIQFFDKDFGFLWSRGTPPNFAPFHCVAVSKIYACMFPFPDHDIAMVNVVPDKTVVSPGGIVTINATVTNEGDNVESFFDIFVELLLNGLPKPEVKPLRTRVASLNSGDSITLTFTWNTTDLPFGNYTLIAKASIVQDEIDVYDNTIIDGVIEIASGIHDIAVTNVTTSKDGCKPMPTVSNSSLVKINVTATNEGTFRENFTLKVYANLFEVASVKVVNLDPSATATVTLTWYTTGFAFGNYTISAYAVPVEGETNIDDNTFTNGWILVVKPGDINGDNAVNFLDAILLGASFGSQPGNPNWNPNADLNGDDFLNFLDAIILGAYFGQ